MPDCAKCNKSVHVPDGLEFSEGDLCTTCMAERLSTAVELLDDLSGLVSYAEIVGGVLVNRSPIRAACDKAYVFLAAIRAEAEQAPS